MAEKTLDEFISELRSDVDKFESLWIKENENNPEQYPNAMELGEWYEQWFAWETMAQEEDE